MISKICSKSFLLAKNDFISNLSIQKQLGLSYPSSNNRRGSTCFVLGGVARFQSPQAGPKSHLCDIVSPLRAYGLPHHLAEPNIEDILLDKQTSFFYLREL